MINSKILIEELNFNGSGSNYEGKSLFIKSASSEQKLMMRYWQHRVNRQSTINQYLPACRIHTTYYIAILSMLNSSDAVHYIEYSIFGGTECFHY